MTTDAVKILYRRYVKGNPKRMAAIEAARLEAQRERECFNHVEPSASWIAGAVVLIYVGAAVIGVTATLVGWLSVDWGW